MQLRWSSRARHACTARRWSTCTSSCTRPWSVSKRKGVQIVKCPLGGTDTKTENHSPWCIQGFCTGWLATSLPTSALRLNMLQCVLHRQRESGPRAAAEGDADADDEFDDEETFLNLDDVLEGANTDAVAADPVHSLYFTLCQRCTEPCRKPACALPLTLETPEHTSVRRGGSGHRPQRRRRLRTAGARLKAACGVPGHGRRRCAVRMSRFPPLVKLRAAAASPGACCVWCLRFAA